MRGKTALRAGLALVLASLVSCAEPENREPSRTPDRRAWTFTDVTAAAGLANFKHETGASGKFWMPESIGSGAAFVDYDGDGHLDIVLVRGGFLEGDQSVPALEVYRNSGDGTFSRRTREAGLEGLVTYAQGVYAADVDNDGDADLFLTTLGKNILLRNDGGVFADVSDASGLAEVSEWSTPAAFLDADLDGDLDLFVGNYVDWTPENDAFCSVDGVTKTYCTPRAFGALSGRIYENGGNGVFRDRTTDWGMADMPGNSLGAVSFDYNADGRPDLYVANDLRPNALLKNNGDGTFVNVAVASGAAFDERGQVRAGMGVDAGIVDSSGHPTIFVGNFSDESIAAFRYGDGGVFMSRDAASRLMRASLKTLTFALFLFDANLDGHLDLFAVNGHVEFGVERVKRDITYRQPVHLFVNDGDETFRDVVPDLGEPLTQPLAGRGGAYGDYDGDGDLDVLISENDGPAHLWRNDLLPSGTDGAHYLRVHLEGSRSNRDALGTRVLLYVGKRVLQQERRGGTSYLSTSEPVLTFGLGTATRVDSVVVSWPSGARTRLTDVPADQVLRVNEPPRP